MKLHAPRLLVENSNKIRYISITLEEKGGYPYWPLRSTTNAQCGDTLQERLALEVSEDGFHAGFFDFNNQFHRTPIQIGHVLIDSITAQHHEPGWDQVAKNNNRRPDPRFHYTALIHCNEPRPKTGGQYLSKPTTLTFKDGPWTGLFVTNAEPKSASALTIRQSINLINRFLSKTRDFQAIRSQYNWRHLNAIEAIGVDFLPSQIEPIEIKLFRNSSNRGAGKDEVFWKEIELSKLPKSQYLKEMFASIIRGKYGPNSHTRIEGDKILLSFDHEYAYSAPESRSEIESGEDVLRSIKTLLLLHVGQQIDLDDLKCDMFANMIVPE